MNTNEELLPDENLQGVEEVTEATEDQALETSQEQTDEAGTEEVEAKEEVKKPTGFHKRIQRFENKLREQEAEKEYWRNLALGAEKERNTKVPEQAKLSLADFDSVEDYVEARERQLRESLLKEVQTTTQRVQQETQMRSSYASKVSEAQKELPDWDEVLESVAEEPTAPETVQFCLESSVGPKIAYHLAKNPELHEKINGMTPLRRVAELGKIEDLLSKPKAPETQRVTKAPGKITEVKGTASTVAKHPGDATSYAEWKALDAARRAKK